MKNLDVQCVTVDIPYITTDEASLEAVTTLAKLLANLPGIHHDESLTFLDSNNNFKIEYLCMDDTNIPVIGVFNFYNSSRDGACRAIGYSFLDNAGDLMLNATQTSSINSCFGQFWYRLNYMNITQWQLYYAVIDDNLTLWSVCTNVATNVNLANIITLDSFISTLKAAGSNKSSNKTVFRYVNGQLGWANKPTIDVTAFAYTAVPCNLLLPNKFLYCPTAYIYGSADMIENIGFFSGLFPGTDEYKVFEADGNTYVKIGSYAANYWNPYIML